MRTAAWKKRNVMGTLPLSLSPAIALKQKDKVTQTRHHTSDNTTRWRLVLSLWSYTILGLPPNKLGIHQSMYCGDTIIISSEQQVNTRGNSKGPELSHIIQPKQNKWSAQIWCSPLQSTCWRFPDGMYTISNFLLPYKLTCQELAQNGAHRHQDHHSRLTVWKSTRHKFTQLQSDLPKAFKAQLKQWALPCFLLLSHCFCLISQKPAGFSFKWTLPQSEMPGCLYRQRLPSWRLTAQTFLF